LIAWGASSASNAGREQASEALEVMIFEVSVFRFTR
jgi:hypothetical protein